MRRRTAKGFTLAAVVAACGWFYAGFFHTDPLADMRTRQAVWLARVLLPLLFLAVPWARVAVRRGRLRPATVARAAIGVVVVLIGALAAQWILFDLRAARPPHEAFHPYLQLMPTPFQPQTTDTRAFRVFCLGGSTTEFTDSHGRGWPARLQERLKGAAGDRPVEVYSLGRQWYSSLHTLINYEVNLRHHKPDAVIVMHAINDLLQNADFSRFSLGPFRDDYGHFAGPVTRLVTERSFLKKMAGTWRSAWYYRPRQSLDAPGFPGVVPFERNLRTLVELAKADGALVAFATQPNLMKETMTAEEQASLLMWRFEAVGPRTQWTRDTVLRGMRTYNDITRKVARETGALLIDADAAIPRTLANFSDEVHYRDPAFDLVAECMAGKLRPAIQARTGAASAEGTPHE
jgi:lysophospholipase L1-like esterase